MPANNGTADKISILSTTTDPVTLLPVITALNANDSNTGTNTGDLVINYTLPTGTQQTITVAGHYTGTNTQTGVERISFNGATFAGIAIVRIGPAQPPSTRSSRRIACRPSSASGCLPR